MFGWKFQGSYIARYIFASSSHSGDCDHPKNYVQYDHKAKIRKSFSKIEERNKIRASDLFSIIELFMIYSKTFVSGLLCFENLVNGGEDSMSFLFV